MRHAAIAAVLAFLAAAPGMAAPTHGKKTANLTLTGKVAAKCTLAATPFTFTIGVGYIHSPGNTILKQNTLSVACTNGTSAQISMNAGLYGNAAGSQYGTRSMSDGTGDYLGYELCHDNACSSKWTSSGFNYISPTSRGSTLPVWTRILTGQSHVKQGTYSDAITVTISF